MSKHAASEQIAWHGPLFCTVQRATTGFYSHIAVFSLLHPQCQIRAVESGALTLNITCLQLSSFILTKKCHHNQILFFFFLFWQLYRILYKVSFALLRGVGHHVLATPMFTCRWCHCSLEGSGFSSLPLGCSCVSDILWFLCVIGAWLVKNDPDPFDYSFCPCHPLLLSQYDAEHLLTHLTASNVISPVKPNPVCFGRRFKV